MEECIFPFVLQPPLKKLGREECYSPFLNRNHLSGVCFSYDFFFSMKTGKSRLLYCGKGMVFFALH